MQFSSNMRLNICKRLWFLFFARKIGKNISKNVSSKYSQKLLDHAKQSATGALKLLQKE